jgi:hypothetical protein
MKRFPVAAAGLLLFVTSGFAQAQSAASAPDTGYRAGTVPVTGADATNTNVGVPAAVAPSEPARQPTVGGFGPLSTENGVASSGTSASAASAAVPRRPASAPAARQHHRPAATRAASAPAAR